MRSTTRKRLGQCWRIGYATDPLSDIGTLLVLCVFANLVIWFLFNVLYP